MDSKDFQRHLGDKSKNIKTRFDVLFRKLAASRGEITPEIEKLESQVKSLLASQKESAVQLDRLKAENASAIGTIRQSDAQSRKSGA